VIFRRSPHRPAGSAPGTPSRAEPPDPVQVAHGYHQRTKHAHQRYAASLGYLDWDNQPDPFRRYLGAPLVALPQGGGEGQEPPYDALFAPAGTADAPPPRALDARSLGDFLFHALALSAWKQAGDARWALRVNPSSGNLHPTEGYLLLPPLAGVAEAAALHHYAPREHALELRAQLSQPAARALAARLGPGGFLVGLGSIPWREAWKYGERAWRYCQHDVGHALAALRLAAALQGWTLRMLPLADAALARLLGLDRSADFHADEAEHPDLVALVQAADAPAGLPPTEGELLALVDADARWHGRANLLSAEHHPWEVIDVVEAACRRSAPPVDAAGASRPAPASLHALAGPLAHAAGPPAPARAVIRKRRSAVAMDARTRLSRAAFERMLARVVPALCPHPWDALPWPVSLHLGLFVHRVDGLPPGLYALPRTPEAEPRLMAAMSAGARPFRWERLPGTPDELPLRLLAEGDTRRLAASVSCGQDIAADGAFSLGMLADFDGSLGQRGAAAYRELFWESGVLGQVLYLEAQALGIAATGIGCFFDDAVHACFGLADSRFQSLYHFTVGGALEDTRVTGLPAYPAPEA